MLLFAADLDAFRYMARAGRRKNVRHGKWVKGNNFNKAQEKQEEHKLQEIWGKIKRPNLRIFAIKGDEM